MFYLCGYVHSKALIEVKESFFSNPINLAAVTLAMVLLFYTGCMGQGLNSLTSVKIIESARNGEFEQYEKEYFLVVEDALQGKEDVQDIQTVPSVFYNFKLDEGNSTDVIAQYYA